MPLYYVRLLYTRTLPRATTGGSTFTHVYRMDTGHGYSHTLPLPCPERLPRSSGRTCDVSWVDGRRGLTPCVLRGGG